MKLLPIDEINQLKDRLNEMLTNNGHLNSTEVIDAVLDILILSYMYGVEDADEMIGIYLEPDDNKMADAIYKKVKGEDFQKRISGYLKDIETTNPTSDYSEKPNNNITEKPNTTNIMEILRVVDTESHRIYNTAVSDVGKASGMKLDKTWATMLDEKVRDTHGYLEGMTVPFDSRFYTYDGDSAEFPGDFELPENNVNCRCTLRLSVSEE